MTALNIDPIHPTEHHQPIGDAPQAESDTALLRLSVDVLEGRATLAELNGLDAQALEQIYARGYQAWQDHDLEAATADFAFLATHQPLDRRFHFAFACAMQAQGLLQEALNSFGVALAMQANEPRAIYHIAECLHALGDAAGAQDALRAVILLSYAADAPEDYSRLRQDARALLDSISH